MSERSSSKRKAAVIIAVAVLFILAIVITLSAERWVTFHPTPVKSVTADELDAGALPPEKIGSTNSSPVKFSLDCGFYSSGEKLYLSAENAVKILYTKNGNDPRTDGKPYMDGINLRASSDKGCSPYSITACAVYEDGSFSEPVTRSYFVDSDIASRFDCLVFSVTIDPDMLYNYEDGIFILGKMRDDYLATNPTKQIQPTDPANWNQRGMQGERPAYLEVYEYDGTCVISQKCGMRIFGGWSRANDQKNLRFYARSEYDEVNNRFRYEFFPDAVDSNGDKLKSQKKLSLRACANDNGALFARDDTMSYLAMAADIDAKHSRPAAVFLNGEYYGFAWCQEVFSQDWLDHKYNVTDGVWDIVKGCEYMIKDDPDSERSDIAKSDWERMYSYAYRDLTDDATFAELEQLIDVDNFLTYYALNSYIGNGDWPNNNYKAYRYISGDKSLSSEEERFDGRWRFMLFDTDFSLGLYGHDFLERHIANLFKETYFNLQPLDWDLDVHDDGEKYQRSDLLISMCKRQDVKEKFISIMFDMMNYYYESYKVKDKLDEMHKLRLHELVAASNEGKAMVWSVSGELKTAKEWIEKRPYAAKKQLASVFPEYDNEQVYKVSFEPTEHATVKINTASITFDDTYDYSGEYFKGLSIPISCQADDGYEFEYFSINGVKVYDSETVISDEIYGDSIEIEVHVKNASAGIDIYEVSYKGAQDYIVLKNRGTQVVTTKGLAFVDNDTNEAFVLPVAEIKPGKTLKIVCKNYSRNDALGSITCGFSLKEGETLKLLGENGNVIKEIYLRDAAKGSALRLDESSGRYAAVTPFPKQRTLDAELPSWGKHGGWGW